MSLPTESRPVRMDPELAERVEALLEEYSGTELEIAQDAVMHVYQSGFSGSFDEIVDRYRTAIDEALAEE